MKITRTSIVSGKTRTLDFPTVTKKMLSDYETGDKPIQIALPGLTPSQREFIMTGIVDSEWDKSIPAQ